MICPKNTAVVPFTRKKVSLNYKIWQTFVIINYIFSSKSINSLKNYYKKIKNCGLHPFFKNFNIHCLMLATDSEF